jgi:hypothetical protein
MELHARAAAAFSGAYLVEHSVELVARFTDAITIVAIHHEDQALRVLEVMPPKRADLQGVRVCREPGFRLRQ